MSGFELLDYGAVRRGHFDTAKKHMGAASELRAAVHLMQQGFDVYRCVAAHAPFDLVAHRDGQLYRVEVKTLSKPAKEYFLPPFTWPVNDEWDLVVICGDGVIFQWPHGTTREQASVEVAKALGLDQRVRVLRVLEGPPNNDQMVLAVMQDDPERYWKCGDVVVELNRRGWSTRAVEPRRVITHCLRSLLAQGSVVRAAPGVYVLPETLQ